MWVCCMCVYIGVKQSAQIVYRTKSRVSNDPPPYKSATCKFVWFTFPVPILGMVHTYLSGQEQQWHPPPPCHNLTPLLFQYLQPNYAFAPLYLIHLWKFKFCVLDNISK